MIIVRDRGMLTRVPKVINSPRMENAECGLGQGR
jgi:hypothetical protein